MSRTVQLSEIRDQVRFLADAENTTGEAWAPDADLLQQINASVGKYHTLLVQAIPGAYVTSTDITGDGSSSYALPADWYATRAVEYVNGDHRRELVEAMWQERNGWGNGNGDGQAYLVVGSALWLRPKPTSGTYRHWYATHADVLASDTDTVEGYNGWEAYIWLDVAIALRVREQSDISPLLAQRDDIERAMLDAALKLKQRGVLRVADIRPTHLRGPGEKANRYNTDFWDYR